MQTFPVFYDGWHGHAYRQHGHWHVAPKQLSDHIGLSWKSQYRKIQDTELAEGMVMMTIPSAGGAQETLTLRMGHFAAWIMMIQTDRVQVERRPFVVSMKRGLYDALERQLGQMFGLPGMKEAEDFERLPMPPLAVSQMEPEAVRAARAKVLADAPSFAAVRFMSVGLAASRIAPLVQTSVYAMRNLQRHCRRLGLIPLPPAQQRLLDQPSLFGTH